MSEYNPHPSYDRPGDGGPPRRSRPSWGLVAVIIVATLLAGSGIGYLVSHNKSSAGHGSIKTARPRTSPSDTDLNTDPYAKRELVEARQIPGLTYKVERNHTHVSAPVTYDASPPVGGDHSQIWADCTGTVYTHAIANENAVHMLEHGAVWITYKPGLPADQVATLTKLVDGIDRMAMSPYRDLKTNISLQAWGYQLFVDDASDPRIQQFIDTLRFNPKTTPENAQGVTCSDPQFKSQPSTFGHPIFQF